MPSSNEKTLIICSTHQKGLLFNAVWQTYVGKYTVVSNFCGYLNFISEKLTYRSYVTKWSEETYAVLQLCGTWMCDFIMWEKHMSTTRDNCSDYCFQEGWTSIYTVNQCQPQGSEEMGGTLPWGKLFLIYL